MPHAHGPFGEPCRGVKYDLILTSHVEDYSLTSSCKFMLIYNLKQPCAVASVMNIFHALNIFLSLSNRLLAHTACLIVQHLSMQRSPSLAVRYGHAIVYTPVPVWKFSHSEKLVNVTEHVYLPR